MTDTDPQIHVTARVLLDVPADTSTLAALGRTIGAAVDQLVSMISLSDGAEIGASWSQPPPPDPHPTGQVRALANDALIYLLGAVRDTGRQVLEVTHLEVSSQREVERRLAQPSIPPMVDATQFAELAGVTTQRIYLLTKQRRDGQRDDFPPEVVSGYWLRSSAEAFARRPRPTGRPRKHDGSAER